MSEALKDPLQINQPTRKTASEFNLQVVLREHEQREVRLMRSCRSRPHFALLVLAGNLKVEL